jgi:hypothetical protein
VDDAVVDVVAAQGRHDEGRKVEDQVADVVHSQALKQARKILKTIKNLF